MCLAHVYSTMTVMNESDITNTTVYIQFIWYYIYIYIVCVCVYIYAYTTIYAKYNFTSQNKLWKRGTVFIAIVLVRKHRLTESK